jgi:hypothetical protein
MPDLSDKTATRLLRLLRDKHYVVAGWDNAAFVELQRRDHVTAAAVYSQGGGLMRSKLYQITPGGRAWLQARG